MDYVRKYWHVIAGIVCVAVLGTIYLRRDTGLPVVHQAERTALVANAANIAEPETQVLEYQPAERPAVDIMVHIEGAVNSPGVFTLPYGSRVNDVLILAGGATEEADLARINLAAFLIDAQQIIVPKIGEELEHTTGMPVYETASGLININTADAALLSTLPGIGPVLAGNIINHRETQGPFTSIDQLTNVPRIGQTTLENIRALITVN